MASNNTSQYRMQNYATVKYLCADTVEYLKDVHNMSFREAEDLIDTHDNWVSSAFEEGLSPYQLGMGLIDIKVAQERDYDTFSWETRDNMGGDHIPNPTE